jgi:hypothetical protein
MLDLAVESGMVVKPNMGWYQLVDEETGELIGKKVRQADTQQILDKVMESEKFASFIQNKYKLGMVKMMAEDQEAEDE